MGGDFNLVMDGQKDKEGGKATEHSNSLKEVQNKTNSLDLVDGWRILNLDAERFTWRRRKPLLTLHVHVANNNNPRGLGFWKLNTSFLLDREYIEFIKKTVDEVAKECRNNDDVDAVLLWKMQI